jgi:putative CocE/NonD family hydrolase
MPRRLGLVAAVLALTASVLALVPARAAEPVRETGYVATRDGTQLNYTVVRPAGPGPFPTLFTYDGYDAGFDPDPQYIEEYVPKGYAFIGVSLRGSGCSGGVWDFFQPAEATDGYDVIEWIAKQPWSNGRVGMIGKSYPGITQLFTAATRPPHLVAIAPGHTFGDIYRDIAYPGGIFNYGFSALWSFVSQPYYSYNAAFQKTLAGDPVCAQHLAERPPSVRYSPFLQAQEHQWDDALIRERSPLYLVDRIDVPTWTVASWQDEQVGPRSVNWIGRMKAPVYGIVTNGDHGMYRTKPALAQLAQFIDHFVKGENNGFEKRPAHFQVWWEAGRDGSRAPGFTSWIDTWPPRTREERRLFLGTKTLRARPTTEGTDTYTYVPTEGRGTPDPDRGGVGLPAHEFWPDQRQVPGTYLSYTSNVFTEPTAMLGTASADLWITSTAPDTDLQVTLTELRNDSSEEFVQQGWLRASHRALNEAESTPTRPQLTQQQSDQQMLSPGVPVKVRIEIFPFGHVFREGSRLRLTIDAPKPLPDLWSFVPYPVPAQNAVLHDAEHRSSLVLPIVDLPTTFRPPFPKCGTVIHQPCRALS